MQESNLNRVVNSLQQILKKAQVDRFAEIGKTYGWDSLRHLAIVTAIEREFAIKISPNKITALTSVEKILSFLSELEADNAPR